MAVVNPVIVVTLSIFLQFRVSSPRNLTALSSIVFTNIDPPEDDVHSEYYFGRCAMKDKLLVAHDKWNYTSLEGKMVIRKWLNLTEIPTCVYIRAKSSYGDIVKYHAFKFNVCVCLLVYNYAGKKFTNIFYEWYIPVEMIKSIDWDLYFYTPN